MITLYTWKTPNGRKASIMLEETGLPYQLKPIDIGKGEQLTPEFLAISPNNKIPAIVDEDAEGGPLPIFESGAILQYLAEKSGKFLPAGRDKYKVLEWVFWQVGGLGPMFGQLGYFGVFAREPVPPAIDRFRGEAERLLGVMERRLTESPYLGGAEYSIADIASYSWAFTATQHLDKLLGETLQKKPHVKAWLEKVGARPAVQKGMTIP